MSDKAAATHDNVLEQAIEHHQQGALTKAEWGYRQVLEMQPSHPDALHLLGVIAHQMGDSVSAIEQVRKSLSVNPEQPIAWNNLGNIYSATGQLDEALNSYKRAVDLNPDYAQAHHNLGNVLSDAKRENESAQSYRRAIALHPDATSYQCLAALLEKSGQLDDAVASYRQAIQCEPDSVVAYRRLGTVLRKLDRLEEARVVYEAWLQFDPGNPVASHLRAACEPAMAPVCASNEYVKATFDGFADEFEECLTELDYRAPQLVAAEIEKHVPQTRRGELNVADLGCGTGLCAVHLRSWAGRLIGVDLSTGMLAKAAEREVYDELVEAELTEFLARYADEFDLIVSADTLIYVGHLEPVFAAAKKALRLGGAFVFTVEKLHGQNNSASFRLNRFGRYTHDAHGLRQGLAKAGLEVCRLSEEVLRREANEPVIGLVVTARKPAST